VKILLPDSVPLAPDLPDGWAAVTYAVGEPLPVEHEDADVLVAWSNPQALLEDAAIRLRRLRWVQTLAAGPDAILAAGFGADVVITSGVGLHSATVAEHALTLVLTLVRRMPAMAAAQARHEWSRELGGPQPLHPATGPVTTLIGARVLIWGFGAIGQTLAPMLAALGATVTGAARIAGERGGFTVVDDSGLDAALAGTDVLVMILPATPETDDALNAHRIDALPDDAYIVNVGRGNAVAVDALIAALRSGHLAGAALDVTPVEPLPTDSPLWSTPNLIITPHAAGGRPVGADELIARNAAHWAAGEALRNVVSR